MPRTDNTYNLIDRSKGKVKENRKNFLQTLLSEPGSTEGSKVYDTIYVFTEKISPCRITANKKPLKARLLRRRCLLAMTVIV